VWSSHFRISSIDGTSAGVCGNRTAQRLVITRGCASRPGRDSFTRLLYTGKQYAGRPGATILPRPYTTAARFLSNSSLQRLNRPLVVTFRPVTRPQNGSASSFRVRAGFSRLSNNRATHRRRIPEDHRRLSIKPKRLPFLNHADTTGTIDALSRQVFPPFLPPLPNTLHGYGFRKTLFLIYIYIDDA